MLDLQNFVKDNFYEVRLLDGTELQLKRPKQKMMEYLLNLQNFLKDNSEAEAVSAFFELFLMILNRNINGITFSADDIEDYDISLIVLVIRDYFDFWNKDLEAQVNFQ